MKFLLILSIILPLGCASKKDPPMKKVPRPKSTKEILEDFDVDKKVIQKYQEKIVEPEPVQAQPVSNIEQMPTPAKTTITQAKPVAVIQPIKVAPKPTPPPAVATKPSKKEKPYPEDYKEADKNSQKFWHLLKPNVLENEKIYMDMNYLGMKTGTILLETKPKNFLGTEPVFHFRAELESAPFYRYVYELDDKIDSFIAVKNFSPRKYKFVQRESAQSVDDLQLFDSEKKKVMWFYERETKAKKEKKQRTSVTPFRYQDPLSVIYFIRSLPLNKGDKYIIPVVNKSKLLTLEVMPEEHETLETAIGKLETIRVHVMTQYTGESLKSGDMMFWFTRDAKKIFVKVKAKIKIGAVNGEITKYSH
jgi:hypothetical protein